MHVLCITTTFSKGLYKIFVHFVVEEEEEEIFKGKKKKKKERKRRKMQVALTK